MSFLSPRNRVFLLSLLALLAVAVPHVAVSVQSVGRSTETAPVNQAVLTIRGNSSIKLAPRQVVGQAPIIQGWGGVTLDEASNDQMQSTLLRLNQSGYNGVRIGFSGTATQCSSGELGSWNRDWFN